MNTAAIRKRPGRLALVGMTTLGLAVAIAYWGERHWWVHCALEEKGSNAHVNAEWTRIGAGSSGTQATDIAFAAGRALTTNGTQAILDLGAGVVRPLEIPAVIERVFGAGGALFAGGMNGGAPFLVMVQKDDNVLVVPMPCTVHHLAGEGALFAGVCDDRTSLVVSTDFGLGFHREPFDFSSPQGLGDEKVERRIEALAVGREGALLLAVAQQWQSQRGAEMLLWTWTQLGVQSERGKPFCFVNLPGVVRTLGIFVSSGMVTLLGLEADNSGTGLTRPRIFRGRLGESPTVVGEPGPLCGQISTTGGMEGILLGEQIAAINCGQDLVETIEGGHRWSLVANMGRLELLRGGDMQLFLRAGGKVMMRRFSYRSEEGATAVVLARDASGVGGLDGGGTRALSLDIREPPGGDGGR